MQMAPPSITKPFSILGSTTRMNGGAKGKLSGKMRWRRMLGTSNSIMSCASGDSGSRWYNLTCHSNKLSLINSACDFSWVRRTNGTIVVVKMRKFNFYANFLSAKFHQQIYRKDFLASIVLWLLQFSELLHQSLGSDCCVDFGDYWKLRFAAVTGRNCAAAKCR